MRSGKGFLKNNLNALIHWCRILQLKANGFFRDQPMLISASSYTLIDELDAPILKRRRNSIDSDEPTFVADINDNIPSHKRPMPTSGGAKSEMAAVEECLARMSVNGDDQNGDDE